MSNFTPAPMRYIDGTISGQIWEGSSTALRVRTSTPITIRRDTDGTWLAYVTLDATRLDADSTSKSVEISDPSACRAFDALFELIADPVEFEGCTIASESIEAPQAAD